MGLAFSATHSAPSTSVQGPPWAAPIWKSGDSWQVVFTVKVGRGVYPPEPMRDAEIVYTYTVLPDVSDPDYPGVDIVKIAATSKEGPSNWRLTFDKNRHVLLRTTAFQRDEDRSFSENPFGADSWMGESNMCLDYFIHDFPKFPLTEGVRRVEPPPAPHIQSRTPEVILPYISHSSTRSFEEQVSFSGAGDDATATIVMSRTDAVTKAEQKTTIVWGTAKWWNRASIKLGDRTCISAVLQPPATQPPAPK